VALYKILTKDRKLQAFRALELGSEYQEKDLEDWIEQNPEVLLGDEPLLMIGRQVSTPVGVIDLLALDSNGSGVIIELKRAPSQREAVSQALEYASWLSSLDTEELIRIAENYLRRSDHQLGFEEAWQDSFGSDIPEVSLNSSQRLFIVVEGEDDRITSLTRYLRSLAVDVSLLSYSFYRTETGEEILLLQSQLGAEEGSSAKGPKPTEGDLIKQWHEEVVAAYGAFKELLLSAGLYLRPKKSGISFYVHTKRGSVFVCFFHSTTPEANVWMRSDSLTTCMDFAAASEAIKERVPPAALVNHTPTWFIVRFPASLENGTTMAKLILDEVVARFG